ncbi:hypothetical protein [Actinomadura monticuli]|uniref:Uncharacterized protein n=1 Tax=Actinomadura monticuli TaxID=3097367 RepID=A0ABV4Q4X9_9ACTN
MSPFWRVAGGPLAVGISCLVAAALVLRLQSPPPPNCDFSCAMSSIGWPDYLALMLVVCGLVAFCVFALICVVFWVTAVVDSLRGR